MDSLPPRRPGLDMTTSTASSNVRRRALHSRYRLPRLQPPRPIVVIILREDRRSHCQAPLATLPSSPSWTSGLRPHTFRLPEPHRCTALRKRSEPSSSRDCSEHSTVASATSTRPVSVGNSQCRPPQPQPRLFSRSNPSSGPRVMSFASATRPSRARPRSLTTLTSFRISLPSLCAVALNLAGPVTASSPSHSPCLHLQNVPGAREIPTTAPHAQTTPLGARSVPRSTTPSPLLHRVLIAPALVRTSARVRNSPCLHSARCRRTMRGAN